MSKILQQSAWLFIMGSVLIVFYVTVLFAALTASVIGVLHG